MAVMSSPLQDLLDALEAWVMPEYIKPPNYPYPEEIAVAEAYRAYKAAPKPLMLERVDCITADGAFTTIHPDAQFIRLPEFEPERYYQLPDGGGT